MNTKIGGVCTKMKSSTSKVFLSVCTLFALLLVAGNSALGKGLFPFLKPAVNTGRAAQSQPVHYYAYIPIANQRALITESQPLPERESVQFASAPTLLPYESDEPDPSAQATEAQPQAVVTEPPAMATESARPQPISPALQSWIDQVKDGEAGAVRGLFVEGLMALRVVQQPDHFWQYVSEDPETATQFQSAAGNVTGLLAHNYLAGSLFYNLTLGQQIVVIYGDGNIARYQVSEIRRYQKLDEDNYYSPFIDQENGEEVSSTDVFNSVYSGEKHLALQTCLEKDGDWSWGLLFIIANPVH